MHKNCLSAISKHQNLLLIIAGLTLILIAFLPRLWLLQTRFFDRDELEHLHTAWLSFEGYLVYRDFFQNHTPLLYLRPCRLTVRQRDFVLVDFLIGKVSGAESAAAAAVQRGAITLAILPRSPLMFDAAFVAPLSATLTSFALLEGTILSIGPGVPLMFNALF